LLGTLEDLVQLFGERQIAAACELTKLYEEIQRGTAAELLAYFRERRPRGEFTLVIAPHILPSDFGEGTSDFPSPVAQTQGGNK
jgi:16S rRNA C1402 (ribose-2'-O) methylase RsmI